MSRRSRVVSVVSPLLLIACAAEPEPGDEVIVEPPPEVTSSIAAPTPEQIEATNRRPCGSSTVAVITTADNDQYAFCAGPEGQGILESLWTSGPSRSRLADNPTPQGLLTAILPTDHPDALAIRAALDAGVAPGEPFLIGTRDLRAPQFAASCTNATFEDQMCQTAGGSPFDDFANVFVDPPWNQRALDCSTYVAFCDPGWGGRNRWATAYYASGINDDVNSAPFLGACGTKNWMVSCGGSTLFEGSWRGGDSGAWTLGTSWWATANTTLVWVWYANAEHLCRTDTDRDDMKVESYSEPGADHNSSTIFMKKTTGLFTCDPE